MAKRDEKTAAQTEGTPGATADAMEQKMVAFAEQLGRIVGTVQAKAEGWLDRDALNAQISSVRDNASELLTQLGGAAKAAAESLPGGLGKTSGSSKSRDAGTRSGAKAGSAAKSRIPAKGKVATKARASSTSGAVNTKSAGKGRSGGAVDAPGKKHRKPMPSESGATGAPRGEGSRIAKLRTANQIRVQQRRG